MSRIIDLRREAIAFVGNYMIIVPAGDSDFLLEKLNEYVSMGKMMEDDVINNYSLSSKFVELVTKLNVETGKFVKHKITQTLSEQGPACAHWTCDFVVLEDLVDRIGRIEIGADQTMKKKVLRMMVASNGKLEDLMAQFEKHELSSAILEMYDSTKYSKLKCLSRGQEGPSSKNTTNAPTSMIYFNAYISHNLDAYQI